MNRMIAKQCLWSYEKDFGNGLLLIQSLSFKAYEMYITFLVF